MRISGRDMTAEELNTGMHAQLFDGDKVVIMPSIHGAKSGLGSFLVGAAIVGIAFWTGGASLAAMGAWSTGFAIAGAALAFTGLSTMLTKTPNQGLGSNTDNGKANQYFSSLENRIGQGGPVPIVYGEMVVGSNVISQGLETR
ncbi:tail tip assembly protein I [Yersinia phage vB_YenS_P400]|nr:tail tip assembly protein I [Yersinia phage vB_YenS_P400]